jgi:tripartite-type tricarboxylate transporter receptor subunit TctC
MPRGGERSARTRRPPFLLWSHADRTDIETLDDFVRAARAAGIKWIMRGTGVDQEDSLLMDFLNATSGLTMKYKAFDGAGATGLSGTHRRRLKTAQSLLLSRRHLC